MPDWPNSAAPAAGRAVTVGIRTLVQAEGRSERTEQLLRGQLSSHAAGRILIYDETSPFRVHTRLFVRPSRVDLYRTGELSLHVVFEQDRVFSTRYRTQAGVMPLRFETLVLEIAEQSGASLSLRIVYRILQGGAELSLNELCIRAQETNSD